MTRPVAILRPTPGNAATAERVRAAGLQPLLVPLFDVVPLAWTPPDPVGFGALLLTSANAARHAGPGLAALAQLPVLAVGPETGRAAEAAGLHVVECGDGGVATLLARQLAAQLDAHAIPRSAVRLAAISARAADADGRGWERVAIAVQPNDVALIAAAGRLAIDP